VKPEHGGGDITDRGPGPTWVWMVGASQ
jgi:hypothetical protein